MMFFHDVKNTPTQLNWVITRNYLRTKILWKKKLTILEKYKAEKYKNKTKACSSGHRYKYEPDKYK